MIARSAVVMWAVVVALLVGGCGSGGRTPPRESATVAPTEVSPSPTPAGPIATDPEATVGLLREWVAVFRVAEVEKLERETQELLRLVAKNIAVAPIGCWVGLREKLGNATGYVSAVVAESREQLDRVIEKVGREPILVGEFPAMCVD